MLYDHSVTPKELALEIIKSVNKRAQDILKKRFGIVSGVPRTLESVGKDYHITRERVRQIIESSLQAIKQSSALSLLEPFENTAKKLLQKTNGVEAEKKFLEKLISILSVEPKQISAVRFLLYFCPEISLEPETKEHRSFWRNKNRNTEEIKKIIHQVEDYFRREKKVRRIEEIIKWAKTAINPKITLSELEVYLSLSPKIGRNVFGEYGLINWTEIIPKGAKDRAYLMLKHSQKPMHFTEIAKRINQFSKMGTAIPTHQSWLKKVHVQTVHNELIKDPRFVLIGRGVYALRDWGYKPGTVADVIRNVLKDAGRPLPLKTIITEVKKQRLARDTTIILNLSNKRLFKKLPNHYYTLVHSGTKPKVLEA